MSHSPHDLALTNGSRIAVIGGGPAGSFFSYFLLDHAKRADTSIELDIYEPKDYTRPGPKGCNHCGGIVSESLVQILASEGINIPANVIQNGIDSYVMHTDVGSARIDTPLEEKRIAAMYRGAGPLRSTEFIGDGFDGFLIKLAMEKGARFVNSQVKHLSFEEGRPKLEASNGESAVYDLVVGAVGLNQHSIDLFKNLDFGFTPPTPTKTYITEIELGSQIVDQYFGNAMHVFLINIPNLQFAAIIPKGNYVTLAMLGNDINNDLVKTFMETPAVKECFPEDLDIYGVSGCKCFPQINVVGARQPYTDRVVLIGDCSVSKLYKNGIGAAFITAKAAATTALFQGISKAAFEEHYWPSCKALAADNQIGKFVFGVTHFIQKRKFIKRGLLRMVIKEQAKAGDKRHLSMVLWDTFTGSAQYRSILMRTLKPQFWSNLIWKSILGLYPTKVKKFQSEYQKQSRSLGKIYTHGEVIVRQGDIGDTLYVIQSGKVQVLHEENGKEVILAELHEADFFGEMAIFEKSVRSSTVRSSGQSRILTIDKKTLMSRIQSDPSLAFRILQRLSGRIRDIDHRMSKISQSDRRNWLTRADEYDSSGQESQSN